MLVFIYCFLNLVHPYGMREDYGFISFTERIIPTGCEKTMALLVLPNESSLGMREDYGFISFTE